MDSETNPGSAPNVSLQNVDADGNVIAVAGDYFAAIPTGAAALHQLPPPAADFTGRKEELDELLQQIAEHGVAIFGVRGMGGIGKTALALVLADQLKDRYPDAQFYLYLKGTSKEPLAATDAMAHVIRGYKPDLKLPDDDAAVRGLYHSVLDGQKALLLMDNAAAAEQVEPLTPPDGCVMLVTSRLRFTIPGLYAKNLDTLAPADAVDLLQTIARRIDDESARKIAELCGYLPLGLRLSASALAERVDLKPAEFATRLEDEQERLSHLDKVDVSIGLSDALLTEELRTRWYQLAVFPDDFDASAAAAVWEDDAEAGKDALGELVRYSVVEWNKDEARYHLHDLVRLYTDPRLTSNKRNAVMLCHARYFCSVARAADELYLNGGDSIARGLGLFDRERANIEAGFAWCSEHALHSQDAVKLCNEFPNAAIHCLRLRLYPRERIVWMKAGIGAAKRLGDKRAEGIHVGNLGIAYGILGDPKLAIQCYQQTLEIVRRIGDRQAEATALGNLGNAFGELGEHKRAVEHFERQLQIAVEIKDRREEAGALSNLGTAYQELGEPRRAIKTLRKALSIVRELGHRQGECTVLGILGLAHSAIDEPRTAIECQDQCQRIAREIGDRYAEAHSSWNLGVEYGRLGKLQRAIELMKLFVDYQREIGHADAAKDAAIVDELRAKMNES